MMSTGIKAIEPVEFHDPHQPGRSCLVAGPDETTLSVPIVCSVTGVVLIFGGTRRRRSQHSQQLPTGRESAVKSSPTRS